MYSSYKGELTVRSWELKGSLEEEFFPHLLNSTLPQALKENPHGCARAEMFHRFGNLKTLFLDKWIIYTIKSNEFILVESDSYISVISTC